MKPAAREAHAKDLANPKAGLGIWYLVSLESDISAIWYLRNLVSPRSGISEI
jgi:hypothetical protein